MRETEEVPGFITVPWEERVRVYAICHGCDTHLSNPVTTSDVIRKLWSHSDDSRSAPEHPCSQEKPDRSEGVMSRGREHACLLFYAIYFHKEWHSNQPRQTKLIFGGKRTLVITSGFVWLVISNEKRK